MVVDQGANAPEIQAHLEKPAKKPPYRYFKDEAEHTAAQAAAAAAAGNGAGPAAAAPPPQPDDSKTMTVTPNRQALAAKLGEFILNELPYGVKIAFPEEIGHADTSASVNIPSGFHAQKRSDGRSHTIEFDSLFQGNTADNPYLTDVFPTDGYIAARDMNNTGELKYWEMKGAHHTVTKAIRIWYTYEVQTEDTAKGDGATKTLVQEGKDAVAGTWLLIGYTGDGHG